VNIFGAIEIYRSELYYKQDTVSTVTSSM